MMAPYPSDSIRIISAVSHILVAIRLSAKGAVRNVLAGRRGRVPRLPL